MVKYNYEINFSNEVQRIISELVAQYQLEIDSNLSLFERLKIKDPEIVIFRAAEIIVAMKKETSMKDVADKLKKDLNIGQKKAEDLADDIKNSIVPFVDVLEIEKMEKAAELTKPEIKIDKEKIVPFAKKVDVSGVEENAKIIQKTKKLVREQEEEIRKVKTVIPQEGERKGPDDYREVIG